VRGGFGREATGNINAMGLYDILYNTSNFSFSWTLLLSSAMY